MLEPRRVTSLSNALASVAVALHLGMNTEKIRSGLGDFKGVNRRFTKVSEVNGIMIIDDYAHHPVEILATLRAARQSHKGRVVAIHQPHRYSRLSNLFEEFCTCFHDADVVGITNVFAAGESSIKGAERDDLVSGLIRHGHRNVFSVENESGLLDFYSSQCQKGDMLIFLGAGSISAWAYRLVENF